MKYNEEDLLPAEKVYLQEVLAKICKLTGVDPQILKTKNRGMNSTALIRQLYYYLANEFKPFEIPLGKIGAVIGRDHATVLQGIKKIIDYIDINDKPVVKLINEFSGFMPTINQPVTDKMRLDVLVAYSTALLTRSGTSNNPQWVAKQAKIFADETFKSWLKDYK